MESPRKFNDCYFYYYSTCTKGDNCVFRHEPSALGCETMCTAWQQGKCLDKRCKLRHMELRKNRKQIPCYWENQPGGCRKIHCPFMHKNPEARTDGIAPSQPAPPTSAQSASGNETGSGEQPPLGGGVGGVGGAPGVGGVGGVVGAGPVPAPAAAPAPVPLLWQQQRQVVLDSAILGVLPASTELLGTRRVVPHPHEPAPNPYAPLPVDPLVVNFEEESDNESAPPSTPIKPISPEEALQLSSPQHKEQELLLLEKIQAAAAAYYGYDPLSTAETTKSERKVRTNLSTKYDSRLSLDEIAGRKRSNVERRGTLDFKVLSLDEIRARKKNGDSAVHKSSIKVNFNRKRKLSTQETITSGGNKIIKVVRSNSVVYKKVKQNASVASSQSKVENKQNEDVNRKRTYSEQSDILYDMQDDELVDNCYEFKRIKLTEQTTKPRLIRNRQVNANKNVSESSDSVNSNDKTEDSDSEVQIVSVEISDNRTKVSDISDCDVIDVDSTKMGEPLDIVDLSEEADDCEVTQWSDVDLDLIHNVPDVVSSCSRFTNKMEGPSATDVVNDIDALLDENL